MMFKHIILTHLLLFGIGIVIMIRGEIYTSTEEMKETLTKLRKTEFYEDLQEVMVKFVMHFEIKKTMTVKTEHGDKEIYRDEEVLNFDKFLIYSTVDIERMRKKVSDATFNFDYPIHAFKFIYAHTTLIDRIIMRMLSTFSAYGDQSRIAKMEELKKISTRYPFPTKRDLKGAMELILELQDFFSLRSSDIATGKSFLGDRTEILSSSECSDIAEYAKSIGKFVDHLSWLEAAERQFLTEEYKTMSENYLYSQLYEAYKSAGCQCMPEAERVWRKLVTLQPDNIQTYPNFSITCGSDKNHESCEQKLVKRSLTTHLDATDSEAQDSQHLSDIDVNFQNICKRNTENQTSDVVYIGKKYHKLLCYHERTNQFFYHLIPFKVEVLNVNPRIIIVYQFIGKSDQKSFIYNGRKNSLTDNKDINILQTQHKVRSQSFILKTSKNHKLVSSIQQRMSALTSRDMCDFENFYLTNYGIGGYDKLNINEKIPQQKISVTLFLNNNVSGGSIAFPRLNFSVQPMERAALFVFNFNSKSTGCDITTTGSDITVYGACPVITGNKWIADQTIRQ